MARALNSLRTIQAGAVVQLRMSAPPPAPWVYEQAESLPPTEIGPELTRGSYQLVWHERGETRLADALRGLGDALERVWRWDGIAQRSVIAPLGATIRYGDVLTIEISGSVYWARPTDDPTNIVWLGAVSAERKQQVRAAIDAARDWFADEYGVETAEFTLYYGDDIDAIVRGYRQREAEHFDDGTEDWWRNDWSGRRPRTSAVRPHGAGRRGLGRRRQPTAAGAGPAVLAHPPRAAGRSSALR